MLCRLSVPILPTELFLITNSPGCSIAGTVSLFPVPGTTPPLANLRILPPEFFMRVLPIPRKNSPTPPPLPWPPLSIMEARPAPIFIPMNAVINGSRGVNASAIERRAVANLRDVLAINAKESLFVTLRTSASKLSFTFIILLAREP